jgi:putative ABC transport system permease protein
MIKNFFKIAIRNLRKNKAFSFINIFGLAVGLTSFLLIASYVYNELNYDKYPANAKNIYRVELSALGNGDVAVYPNVDIGVGPGIKTAFPEVISYTRLSTSGPAFIKYDERQFREDHLAYVDSNSLQLFSIPLIEGDPLNALTDPNSIVISKSFASKYFGNEQPLGKSLLAGKNNLFKITGVFDKIPDNSHFHFDAFLSLSTFHTSHLT